MSRFAEQLRAIQIFNNHNMLSQFGKRNDVCVSYSPRARIKGCYSIVWAIHRNPKLDKPTRWSSVPAEKIFYGPRHRSMAPAREFVAKVLRLELAPSPFGGYLPKQVVARAAVAVCRHHRERG